MSDNNNTLAGWVLAGGILALGLSIVTTKYFAGHAPEKEGFAVVAAEGGGEGGGDSGPPIATLLQTADIAKGEAVFKKCAACHTMTAGGANGIGPNLHGVMGEGVGTGHAGFAFSDALKKVGGKWDFDTMNAWLTSPRKFAPGTKMTFAGLGDPVERANLIAYMNAQGSNLPLPPPPAEGAAPAEGDAAKADEAKGGDPAVNAPEAGAKGPASPEGAPKEGAAVEQAAPANK